jgi:hypothetical protein
MDIDEVYETAFKLKQSKKYKGGSQKSITEQTNL